MRTKREQLIDFSFKKHEVRHQIDAALDQSDRDYCWALAHQLPWLAEHRPMHIFEREADYLRAAGWHVERIGVCVSVKTPEGKKVV